MSNWRRMCQRLEPMASRMASSRLRSAARAAKMLARLAQAARRTRKASTKTPKQKGARRIAQDIAHQSRLHQARTHALVDTRDIASLAAPAITLRLSCRLLRCYTGLQQSHTPSRVIAARGRRKS